MKQVVIIDADADEISKLKVFCEVNGININLEPDRYDIEDATGFDWADSGC